MNRNTLLQITNDLIAWGVEKYGSDAKYMLTETHEKEGFESWNNLNSSEQDFVDSYLEKMEF